MLEMEFNKDQKEVKILKNSSNDEKQEQQSTEQDNQSILVSPNTNPINLKPNDIFYGSFKYNIGNGKQAKFLGIAKIISSTTTSKEQSSKKIEIQGSYGRKYKVSVNSIKIHNITEKQKKKQIEQKAKEAFGNNKKEVFDNKKEITPTNTEKQIKQKIKFKKLEPKDKLRKLIDSGMNNIWMVGPAGCGKSTIVRETAKELEIPYLCISCGIGTSAAEFTGYKYPTREATKFAEFYAKKSIILIDEMTALDPSVAQVINAALANDEIETTTGTVIRHPECIIIATSNTFGNGADRQYVANNQLDASTIDRFIGAIIEVDYSDFFESKYNSEVVNYVKELRNCIKTNSLRRIASTRMIQAGHKMYNAGIEEWKDLLIVNWTITEKNIVKDWLIKKTTNIYKFNRAA